MVAFMVASWYCYTRAGRQPALGRRGGARARCWRSSPRRRRHSSSPRSRFDACASLVSHWQREPFIASRRRSQRRGRSPGSSSSASSRSSFFVVPNWSDYRFYNWQMSVTRKPSYDLKSLVDRATWFPSPRHLHANVVRAGVWRTVHAAGLLARWRELRAGERLLVLWVSLGAAGADPARRRQRTPVRLLHPGVGRARVACARRGLQILPRAVEAIPSVAGAHGACRFCSLRPTWCSARGFGLRFLREISPNVRIAAALAIVFTALLFATWPRIPRALSSPIPGLRGAVLLVGAAVGRQPVPVRAMGGRPYLQELRGVASRSAGCCRRGRWFTANSRTVSRSKTASGRSSSAVGSATTRTGRAATMCDIF